MNGYSVERIPGGMGRDFIREHHYTRGCHNGPMTWGLFSEGRLIGVCAFATPSSEAVRGSIWGMGNKSHVTELHRLVILDETPVNTESWFISRALKGLGEERPEIWGVISFADAMEGHIGVIYQATNALYLGVTGRQVFWRDADGRLHHPRQNGVNISKDVAQARGWVAERREAKHRYLFVIARGSRFRKSLRGKLDNRVLPYPKAHREEEKK